MLLQENPKQSFSSFKLLSCKIELTILNCQKSNRGYRSKKKISARFKMQAYHLAGIERIYIIYILVNKSNMHSGNRMYTYNYLCLLPII